jgi:ABC-type spermidine/putrescine transport system permease subunit II
MNYFCHKCGKKLEEAEKYCSECGTVVIAENPTNNILTEKNRGEQWWLRLAKVIYVILYLPLLLIIPLVWSENTPYYSSYSQKYYGSYMEAFWYSLLTLIIYVVIVRLIKIAFLYIALGHKRKWGVEFTKFF